MASIAALGPSLAPAVPEDLPENQVVPRARWELTRAILRSGSYF